MEVFKCVCGIEFTRARAHEHEFCRLVADHKKLTLENANMKDELAYWEKQGEAIRKVINDEGPRPDVHRLIMSKHRLEWPSLWDIIDQIYAGKDAVKTSEKLKEKLNGTTDRNKQV